MRASGLLPTLASPATLLAGRGSHHRRARRRQAPGTAPATQASPAGHWSADIGSAAKSYRDSVASSTDPLAKVFADVGEAVSATAGRIRGRFGGNAAE
jgi:hypothetical protein